MGKLPNHANGQPCPAQKIMGVSWMANAPKGFATKGSTESKGTKKEMERTPVSSSNIRAIGYDPKAWELEIEFCSGSVCLYHNVSQGEHDALMKAPSKGQHFQKHIRNVKNYEPRGKVDSAEPTGHKPYPVAEGGASKFLRDVGSGKRLPLAARPFQRLGGRQPRY